MPCRIGCVRLTFEASILVAQEWAVSEQLTDDSAKRMVSASVLRGWRLRGLGIAIPIHDWSQPTSIFVRLKLEACQAV